METRIDKKWKLRQELKESNALVYGIWSGKQIARQRLQKSGQIAVEMLNKVMRKVNNSFK